MTFKCADVSEFQANCDWAAYRASGYSIAIYRAYNGYRADRIMPGRRDDLRTRDMDGIGIYAFLVSDVDPIIQAQQFIATVGTLAPHEFPICDAEEVPWYPWAPGQERQFVDAWCSVVDSWFGHPAMLYSDLNTFAAMGGAESFGNRPLWPAHPGGEPNFGHVLWQMGQEIYPGIGDGIDSNQASDLDPVGFMAAVFGGAAPTPAPPPAPDAPPPPLSILGTGTFGLGHPTLAIGDWGAVVAHLQPLVGAYPDGRFGHRTRQLVMDAQNRAGISADGVVGPDTWSHIHLVVRPGMIDGAVAEVQAEVGVGVDGNDGPDTNAHIEGFQRFHGLAIDGVVGAQTYRAMF